MGRDPEYQAAGGSPRRSLGDVRWGANKKRRNERVEEERRRKTRAHVKRQKKTKTKPPKKSRDIKTKGSKGQGRDAGDGMIGPSGQTKKKKTRKALAKHDQTSE